MADNNTPKSEDLVEELDTLLDEEEEKTDNDYIGKSRVYRCLECGHEQIVTGKDTDDVACEECGGDMQKVDEEIYDAQQKTNEEDSGITELELAQDETEDTTDYDETDDNAGNEFDADESDEIPEFDELEPSEDELLELENEDLDDILI